MENFRVRRDLPPNGKPAGNVSQSEKAGSVDREETTVVNPQLSKEDGRADREETAHFFADTNSKYSHGAYLNKMLADNLPLSFGFKLTHTLKNHKWCSICQAPHHVKKCITKHKTFGFLTDWVPVFVGGSSENPSLESAASEVIETFWLTYGCSDTLPFIHHLNCAVYCAKQEDLEFISRAVVQQAKNFRSAWLAKKNLPVEGGLLGGANDKEVPVDKKIQINKERKLAKNKGVSKAAQGTPSAKTEKTEPKCVPTSKKNTASVLSGEKTAKLPQQKAAEERKKETPENSSSDSSVESRRHGNCREQSCGNSTPANKKQSKLRSSGTRSSNNNSKLNEAVGDLMSQLDGAKDAMRDKEKSKQEVEQEEKRKEKEMKKNLQSAAFTRGAMTPVNFKCRPAMNYGYQYKGFSAYGRDMSRPYFYGTTSFLLASVVAPFLFPLSIHMFVQQFERTNFKLYHSIATKQHRNDSLEDATGEEVDARPSETKIGECDLTQIVSTAALTYPAKVVALQDDKLDENEAVVKMYSHDDQPLKRAVARLATVAYHAQRVINGTRYLIAQGNDIVTSFFGSFFSYIERNAPQASVAADPLSLSAPSTDNSREANLMVTLNTQRWFTGPNAFVTKTCDGHSFITSQGNVIPIYCYMLLAAKALTDDRSPVYFSSSTAKEVEKPMSNRKIDALVYDSATEDLDYCAHSYHNASTYGAMSSQISPDVNFAMIYRKLSRYTSINQNRFGSKDLLCNAEQIARLQYWAVREATVSRSSRLHF